VNGSNFLDRTLCHPESYQLASFLLKKFDWNVHDPLSILPIPSKEERKRKWKSIIQSAANSFQVTEDRVNIVVEHLIRSLTNPDPRVVDHKKQASSEIGDPGNCSPLSPSLSKRAQYVM
jgi:transcriptional accessory protein Tex/SPT6